MKESNPIEVFMISFQSTCINPYKYRLAGAALLILCFGYIIFHIFSLNFEKERLIEEKERLIQKLSQEVLIESHRCNNVLTDKVIEPLVINLLKICPNVCNQMSIKESTTAQPR